jgi:DNA-3-methyladenine glycosylase
MPGRAASAADPGKTLCFRTAQDVVSGGDSRQRRAPHRNGVVPSRSLRLPFDPREHGLVEPGRAFYRRDTRDVAQDLLGVWLVRWWKGVWHGGRIVETEAYLGIDDAAAHSWRGRRTARVEPMYRDGGHLYVFLVYGLHSCANVVTRRQGIAQAVLLRAAEGPPGAPPRLLAGPGKLCEGLGITVSDSGRDLVSDGSIRLFRSRLDRRPRIGVSPRIGVDYAGEASRWPLRFFDVDSPAVSGRRKGTRTIANGEEGSGR